MVTTATPLATLTKLDKRNLPRPAAIGGGLLGCTANGNPIRRWPDGWAPGTGRGSKVCWRGKKQQDVDIYEHTLMSVKYEDGLGKGSRESAAAARPAAKKRS